MKQHRLLSSLSVLLLSCFLTQTAQAGRPLIVDDAGINEKGHGHLEVWYERGANGSNAWVASPAYAITDRFEVSGQFSRDNTEKENLLGLQGKYLFTPSQDNGCNFGMFAGVSRVNGESYYKPYASGIATCNSSLGSVHLNLGISRTQDDGNPINWGIAFERNLGPVTADIEYFNERHDKATVQFGLRGDIIKGLQLDGTIGRRDSDTIYSVGMKKQF